MGNQGGESQNVIDISWTQLDLDLELVFLPVAGFPLSDLDLKKTRTFLSRLISAAEREADLCSDVFLQLEQLHGGDSRKRFAKHAPEWLPEVGVGVWPNREPPVTWSNQEFKEYLPGQKPRPLMYQVFKVTGSAAARSHARNELLDVGALLEILSPKKTNRLLETSYDLLHPGITDSSLNCYPFYVPLLERKALEAAAPKQILQWLCGALLYVRQSFEDQGVLVVSQLKLQPLLQRMGAQAVNSEKSTWRFAA